MTKFYTGIGSRETPLDVQKLMVRIAEKMRRNGYTLRSGGAEGADEAFEQGAGDQQEIWLPWLGFNNNQSKLLPSPEAFDLASKFHPAWDRCKRGARALHARNGHQVLGADLKTPTEVVICWTKDGLRGGGTGQALRIAEAHKIPIHDLGLPFIRAKYEQWLDSTKEKP